MYRGRLAAVATKHQKLPLIAPAVFDAVGLACVVADVDTDALGTFSGSVARTCTPLETARSKARLGMGARGLLLGLASEGTIGPHPAVPLLPLDTEIVVLVDDEQGITVAGSAWSTDVRATSGVVGHGQETANLLARAGFPQHRLLVRPEGVAPTADALRLGIADHDSLAAAIATAIEGSPLGLARVENDHRAHCSPSRRAVIAAAAADLAQRLASPCPGCGGPGFGRAGYRYGLPCAWCTREVADAVRAEVHGCPSCDFQAEQAAPHVEVDPGRCPHCNP